MNPPVAIVMAAGKGTRMKSDLPKVLVPVLGRPMIEYVLDALEKAGIARILVVVGYKADDVKAALQHRDSVEFVMQGEPMGTGHAVKSCVPHLEGHDGPVVVVTGDSPLTQEASLRVLLQEFERFHCSCLLGSGYADNPFGLGRIVRNADKRFLKIVEEKDATAEEKAITEVNLSTYVFNCKDLVDFLGHMEPSPVTGEYYVTDAASYLLSKGKDVHALDVLQACESFTINTQEELLRAEDEMRRRLQEDK